MGVLAIQYQLNTYHFYQTLFHLPRLSIFFNRRNRLLFVRFIELQNFRICQLVNKKISHLPHLCNQLNHVSARLISMSRIKSINFYKIGPKMSFFCTDRNTDRDYYARTFRRGTFRRRRLCAWTFLRRDF